MPSSQNGTLSAIPFGRLSNLTAGMALNSGSLVGDRLTSHSANQIASADHLAEPLTLPRQTDPRISSSSDIEHSLCRILQQSHRSQTPIGLLHVELTSPDGTDSGNKFRDIVIRSIQPSIRLSDRIMKCGNQGLLIALNDVNADMLLLFAAQVRRVLGELRNSADWNHQTGIGSITAVLYQPSAGRPFTPARLLDEVQRAAVAAARSGHRTTVLHSITNGRSIPVTQISE